MGLTQETFEQRMAEAFAPLGGVIGVAVSDLKTGEAYGYNADERFPTASTLKVPLLYEMYRQADAGTIDLGERVALDRSTRVPGSGVLQHLDDGASLTIRDLAELMIIVSDNWATDLLFGILGKERIAASMANLGMENTFLPLTIRELFCTFAGVDANDATIDHDRLRDYLKTYRPADDNPGFALDGTNDISTPADMVRILTAIENAEGLSAEGREGALAILKHQNFTSIIPARMPLDAGIECAHKTGSLRGIKNDVGLVFAPDVTYAIAFMSRGQEDVPETVDAMARASRWVWDQIGG